MKLLIDEHFPAVLAEQLCARGHDAVAVVERKGMRGRPDEEIYAAALAEDRWILTENVVDFVPLHAAGQRSGQLVPGLVLTSNRRFPRGRQDTLGALVRALDLLFAEEAHPPGTVRWL